MKQRIVTFARSSFHFSRVPVFFCSFSLTAFPPCLVNHLIRWSSGFVASFSPPPPPPGFFIPGVLFSFQSAWLWNQQQFYSPYQRTELPYHVSIPCFTGGDSPSF